MAKRRPKITDEELDRWEESLRAWFKANPGCEEKELDDDESRLHRAWMRRNKREIARLEKENAAQDEEITTRNEEIADLKEKLQDRGGAMQDANARLRYLRVQYKEGFGLNDAEFDQFNEMITDGATQAERDQYIEDHRRDNDADTDGEEWKGKK